MPQLPGKIVLITGSTDGLGKATALELARRGATILLHGRNPEKGEAVLKEIELLSGRANHTYYNADLASLKAVQAMSEKILAEQSRLDMLINNVL
jgi:NAD(P)-dependent dehydrogenase (short-subunit alcohol dehydrogenase family)